MGQRGLDASSELFDGSFVEDMLETRFFHCYAVNSMKRMKPKGTQNRYTGQLQ